MYLRQAFTVTDRQAQLDVIRDVGWGCMFAVKDGIPIASHLPFLVVGQPGQEVLEGHMSRANPHWETFDNPCETLTAFQGPHTYVTPSLSEAEQALPTWNYAAVHVYGRPTIIEDPSEVHGLIERLVDEREATYSTPWRLESLDGSWVAQKLRGIVAFRIPIERMEATFRLMQNRTEGDRRRVAEVLAEADDSDARGVAALMRRYSADRLE